MRKKIKINKNSILTIQPDIRPDTGYPVQPYLVGPYNLSDGPRERLRVQHRRGTAPLPPVRKRQETHPHVSTGVNTVHFDHLPKPSK